MRDPVTIFPQIFVFICIFRRLLCGLFVVQLFLIHSISHNVSQKSISHSVDPAVAATARCGYFPSTSWQACEKQWIVVILDQVMWPASKQQNRCGGAMREALIRRNFSHDARRFQREQIYKSDKTTKNLKRFFQ